MLLICVPTLAHTPIQTIVIKYSETEGARDFIANGKRVRIVRPILRATSIAPLADDVEELYTLKMENALDEDKKAFDEELQKALNMYEYCGLHQSRSGPVEVYILRSSSLDIVELVIYNSATFSLNSLYGKFDPETLMEISMPIQNLSAVNYCFC